MCIMTYILLLFICSYRKRGKQSLPWTVYSLKIPAIYNVYQEMMSLCREFHHDDQHSYKYLLLESFLILQIALNLKSSNTLDEENSVKEIHARNAIELAELCFK